MALPLSLAALPRLADRIRTPRYARGDLSPGILHVGVGNFHRAHQAAYLHELFERRLDLDWAIVGAGVREADAAMRSDLLAQDFLTTLVAQEAQASEATVIGSMVAFLPPADSVALSARLLDPAIRIVSLTVTEGGYFMNPATAAFDPTHPDIVADAADGLVRPRTVFGQLAAALIRRRKEGIAPFTVMSCDNLPGNGHVAENAVAGLVALVSPAEAAWIRANVAFPSAMVDRITPATTDRERTLLRERFGVEDRRPVFCEGFRQWVVEDRFPAGRPRLEEVGVQFVSDVAPFELMKLRILNGGHAAIAYPAGLLGIRFVHEAMQDPLVAGFLSKLLAEEIVPLVPPVPGVTLPVYKAEIERRFANPAIGDTIPRLCHDGSNRQPKFILPTLRDALRTGRPFDGLVLVSAFWCRYCRGETEGGDVIAPNDPDWPRLNALARRAEGDPFVWLSMSDIYGDLGDQPRFRESFAGALRRLGDAGTRAALQDYLRLG